MENDLEENILEKMGENENEAENTTRKGRLQGARGFSSEDDEGSNDLFLFSLHTTLTVVWISALLTILLRELPNESEGWERVAQAFALLFPYEGSPRSESSLRRRFLKLVRGADATICHIISSH